VVQYECSIYLLSLTPMPPLTTTCHTCTECKSEQVDATLRTTMVTYCRCRACGHIWMHHEELPVEPV
jgi:heterodisulfide reductase subunit A-like polyferredoxin